MSCKRNLFIYILLPTETQQIDDTGQPIFDESLLTCGNKANFTYENQENPKEGSSKDME